MQTFALTPNNPSTFGGDPENEHLNDLFVNPNGQLGVVSGPQDTLQSIENALQLWLGEYDYNTDAGIPYNILLASPNVDNSLIEFQIRQAILSINSFLTPAQFALFGINKIKSVTFSVDKNRRVFSLTAIILLNGIRNAQEITIQV